LRVRRFYYYKNYSISSFDAWQILQTAKKLFTEYVESLHQDLQASFILPGIKIFRKRKK
jgi:hypothetical protein